MNRLVRSLIVSLVLGCSLSACGSDDSKTEEEAAPKAGATAAPKQSGADAPAGALDAQEYRLMRRAAREVERAGNARGFSATLERFDAACAILRDPPTPLLEANEEGCRAQASLLEALIAFTRHARSCGEPQPGSGESEPASYAAGDPQCLSSDLEDIASSARGAMEAGTAANREADTRRIRGRCRKVVGTPARDIRSLASLADAADAFDQALTSGSPARLKRATERFQAALDSLGSGSDENLVKLVRACRPS